MAKWYQKAIIALLLKMSVTITAMPTAKVGAPPARERMLFSPTSWAIWTSMSGVTMKPQPLMTWAADSAVLPMTAAGELRA